VLSVIANKAPRCLTLLRNDAFSDSAQYELRQIVQVQFLQNVAAMGLDCVELILSSVATALFVFPSVRS
jgi:hypothetical protein